MIVHSDSVLGFVLALHLLIAVAVALAVSIVLLFERKFRSAGKLAGATLGVFIAWPIFVSIVSLFSPQTIVKPGDGYCFDIRCVAIQKVEKEARGSQTLYKLNVKLFSDANAVKISFGNVSPLLQDERGRRFPMIDDPSVTPYDTYIDPQQSFTTTLTFAVDGDARELFLTDRPRTPASAAKKPSIGGKKAPFWAPVAGFWFGLGVLGNDGHPLHKPTMLRVL
jgi:hypothetical protein